MERLLLWKDPAPGYKSQAELDLFQLHKDDLEAIETCLKDNKPEAIKEFVESVQYILIQIERRRFQLYNPQKSELKKINTALLRLITLIELVSQDTRNYLEQYWSNRPGLPVFKEYRRRVVRGLDPPVPSGPKGGRPRKIKTIIAVNTLAVAYKNIFEREPSTSEASEFFQIVTLLLPYIGENKTQEPGHLIREALKGLRTSIVPLSKAADPGE
jgi:hypothetical protein